MIKVSLLYCFKLVNKHITMLLIKKHCSAHLCTFLFQVYVFTDIDPKRYLKNELYCVIIQIKF